MGAVRPLTNERQSWPPDEVPLDPAALTLQGQNADTLKAIFQFAVWEMEKLDRFTHDEITMRVARP